MQKLTEKSEELSQQHLLILFNDQFVESPTMIPQTISSIKNLQVSLLHILDSVAVPLQLSPPYFEGLFERDLS